MYPFGAIVLARFPFTDLTGDKLRPALVVSKQATSEDVILCFITSVPRLGPAVAPIAPEAGMIGTASGEWLDANADKFLNVFGFAAVARHGPAPNAG